MGKHPEEHPGRLRFPRVPLDYTNNIFKKFQDISKISEISKINKKYQVAAGPAGPRPLGILHLSWIYLGYIWFSEMRLSRASLSNEILLYVLENRDHPAHNQPALCDS